MKNIFSYALFVILLSFIFVINVNAECSYQERKELLNEAKAVDIGYDIITETKEEIGVNPDSGEEMVSTMEEYTIKFSVANLSDNLYIRYYNLFDNEEHYIIKDDLVNGIYFFEDKDYLNLYTYYFEFRSNNNNCLGDVFSTRKIVKPAYNSFEMFSVCDYEEMKDYKYCQKFITKYFDINENEFITMATEYYESLNKDNDNDNGNDVDIIQVIKNNWYYGVAIIGVIIVIVVVLLIRKKRSEI